MCALVGVVVLYWCQLFYQLQVEWSANDQYAYGWFVPLLAAVLLWRRWADRPAMDQPRGSRGFIVPVLLLILLLPVRLIHEANIGWRSAQWLHGFVLVVLTCFVLWRAGGRPWVKHFGFAVLFLLVAIPWPNHIEASVVQRLMRFVSGLTVECVGLAGVPAFQRGNLIEISSGTMAVDGACSGVRSLQTALMVALLVGEMYRLRWGRRGALVVLGFVVALVANVARTSLLTWSAAKQGLACMETLHTPAGIAVAATVLAGVYLSGFVMAKKSKELPDESVVTVGDSPQGSIQNGVSTSRADDSRPGVTSGLVQPPISATLLLASLAWLCFTEAGTAIWFHMGDKHAVENEHWTTHWPTDAKAYREIPFSKLEHGILRYDTAKGASWQDDAGNLWSLIELRWSRNNKNSFIGRGHTPDLCLTAAGWRLCSEPVPARVDVDGIELPFRRYVFEGDGRTAHVYLGFWDERSFGGRRESPLEYGITRRLKAAMEGKRNQGFKKLEISLIGPEDGEHSLQALKQGLEHLILRQRP